MPLMAQQRENPVPQKEEPAKIEPEDEEKVEYDQPKLTDLQGDPLPRGTIARLGTMRFHPPGDIYSNIALSPDGKLLALYGHAGLCLWDAASGKRVEWFHDTFPALAACFSPDGKTLIAGDKSGTLRRWQVGTGKLLRETRQRTDPGIRQISGFFSADGTTYGVAAQWLDGQEIRLWDVATGSEFLRWGRKMNRYPSAALSPDGKLLAAGGEHGLVHLIDTAAGKEIRRIEIPNKPPGKLAAGTRFDLSAEARGLVFLQEGRLLSGVAGDAVYIWDVETGELRNKIASCYGRVAFSPDGKYLACGNDKGMRLYEIASGKEVRCLYPYYSFYPPIAFSPDGKTLAELRGPTIRLWDMATGKPRHHFPGHQNSVSCLAFSPDGTSLASGDEGKFGTGGTVFIWDPATRKPRHVFPGHICGVKSLAYSPDGKLLASGDGDDGIRPALETKIRIWDLQRGQLRREFFAHLNRVQSLAFSPNGKVLASAGGDRRVRLWDVASGERLRQIRSEESDIQSVTFSPDGKLLILTDLRGERAAWNVDSGQKVRDLKAADITSWKRRPTLSPDGKILAVNNGYYVDSSLQLRDAATMKLLIRLRGHRGGVVMALAFSPDGSVLASGGRDTTVLLWDVRRALLAARRNTR